MSMSISASYYQNYQAHQTAAKKENSLSAQLSIAASIDVSETEDAPKQTLAEFKKEFAQFIDSVPIHPSQAKASQSISIHDNVFEKMMNDPEYKAEIENMVREQLGASFSPADPAFCTMRPDANGVYTGSAGGSFHMDKFEAQSADAFWNRKAKDKAAKKKADEQKLLEQLTDKRRQQQDYLQDLFANKTTAYGSYQTTTAAASSKTSAASILDSLL